MSKQKGQSFAQAFYTCISLYYLPWDSITNSCTHPNVNNIAMFLMIMQIIRPEHLLSHCLLFQCFLLHLFLFFCFKNVLGYSRPLFMTLFLGHGYTTTLNTDSSHSPHLDLFITYELLSPLSLLNKHLARQDAEGFNTCSSWLSSCSPCQKTAIVIFTDL